MQDVSLVYALGYVCQRCRTELAFGSRLASCTRCGGVVNIRYDLNAIRDRVSRQALLALPPGVWRYRDLLPFGSSEKVVSLGEGGTFLHSASRLGGEFGLKRLRLKDETTNPTGSFEDRGVSVAISRALELSADSVCCATTGNLGASVAAYSAKAGLDCTVFIPTQVDLGKLYQMIAYGADIEPLGSYEEAAISATEMAQKSLLIDPADPYFLDGLRTTGFEICEQLGWRAPSVVAVPMGSGAHLSMVHRGMLELSNLEWVQDGKARMVGVQVSGTSPIVDAYVKRRSKVTEATLTRAFPADMSVQSPALANMALQAIRSSGGMGITVSSREVLSAAKLLAKLEGIFAEPAAASVIAGIEKLRERGSIDRDEVVVCVITGAGLKDPITARRLVRRAKSVETVAKAAEHERLSSILGLTKMSILQAISSGESYGYGIWKILSEKYSIRISIPSVYQHLTELVDLGLMRRSRSLSVGGRPERLYYHLTERGRAILGTFTRER